MIYADNAATTRLSPRARKAMLPFLDGIYANPSSLHSLGQAAKEALKKREENAAYVRALRDRLAEGLSKIPYSVINGDTHQRLPGNLNLCFEGIEGESLLLLLDDKGICASSGSACTSGSLDPSHVLLAIGRPREIAHGSLRLSLSPRTQKKILTT